MARENDDLLMTPELAEYFSELGFTTPRRRGMRGLGEEPTAVAVSVVQRGLNYLARTSLAVDNDYGPNTARALASWILTLPSAARAGYSVVPSTDRPYPHWLYVLPGAIAMTLEQAAAQPVRSTPVATTGSSVTVAQAAQQFQNDIDAAPGFASTIETYARAHGGTVPAAVSSAYLAWYASSLGVRDIIVAKMRSSAVLANAITTREPGSIVSEMASLLSTMRPVAPGVGVTPAPTTTLGIVWTAPLVLGVVIAIGASVVLTTYEASKIVESYNLRARLEATLAALRAQTITPAQVPSLPGGGAAPVEPGHAPPGGEPQSEGPFDWLKWLAIGLGVVVAGAITYRVLEDRKEARGTERALPQ